MAYEMNNTADRAFDWDEGFDNSAGTFLLLAEQDCPFEVIKLERQRYEGGAKMGPCKMALLTIRLYGKEGVTTVTHRLYLHTKTIGLLSAFFLSIGQAKPDDEVIRPRWDRIEGAKGLCHVGIHEFVKQSGPHAGETGQSNEIVRFLPPAEQPAQPAQPAPQQVGYELRCPDFASGRTAPSQNADRGHCSASPVSAAGSGSAAQQLSWKRGAF